MKKVSRKNQEKELYYKAKIVQFDQLVAKLYSLV